MVANQDLSRGRKTSGEARREAILDATVGLLAEVGYHGLSMRDLARRVGISHPGVIYHFPSKESLVMAVIKRCEENSNFCIEKLDSMDPFEIFHAFLELSVSLEKTVTIVELDCLLAVEAASPVHVAHKHFVTRFQILNKTLNRVFTHLIAEGIIKADASAEYLANSILAQWYGLQIQWLYDRENVDVCRLLTYTIMRQLDLDNPRTYEMIFSSSFISPDVFEIIQQLANYSIKDLLQKKLLQLNEIFLDRCGLKAIPGPLLQKIIMADELTVKELRYHLDHGAFSIEMLGRLVVKEVFTRTEMDLLVEKGIFPADAVKALTAVLHENRYYGA